MTGLQYLLCLRKNVKNVNVNVIMSRHDSITQTKKHGGNFKEGNNYIGKTQHVTLK